VKVDFETNTATINGSNDGLRKRNMHTEIAGSWTRKRFNDSWAAGNVTTVGDVTSASDVAAREPLGKARQLAISRHLAM
jgi:type IV secretory pathway TrbL component